MTQTKIEWCDSTWNPVWGCFNNCPYCYARKFARRFGSVVAQSNGADAEGLKAFKPTWLQKNFERTFPKKPSRIFVNSMSDLFFWKPGWMLAVMEVIRVNPQHTFLILTKQPDVYHDIPHYPKNAWLGVSVSTSSERWRIEEMKILRKMKTKNKMFVSLEPLLCEKTDWMRGNFLDWTIIGLKTGGGMQSYNPPRGAINDLYGLSRLDGRPLFMKDSVGRVWDKQLTREFPEM
ncbi:phage Gp37/Gp68 family protein [Prosthecochloris sp. SCSIO W1102]|uniref:DUF5131 family protein n=1 Tax=Prosthecochloris sp. SCSIO W1102 TaxID=2992243 RepID=UPI00223D0080|nr:DUF5131 family protein [Prosthecochloris sp. SCSIO W1102]UZJ39979.1 phage Gp37/Gp68 family protein [Prosthecochloris sp. SCSIO W1102]